MIDSDKLDNFERAFSAGSGGCRRLCECGKVYYNPDTGWDWEKGELEELASLENAVALDYTPRDISFEGKYLVDACDCWHPRAERLMQFIDGHAQAIATYLTSEKKRKTAIAERSPVVGEGE